MKNIFSILLLIILFFNLIGCSKEDDTTPNNNGGGSTQNGITVTTIEVTNIKTILASVNCKVVVDPALNSITQKGIVWSTSQNPTTALTTKTADGSSTGDYQSQITNLQSNTKYYIKGYAIATNGSIIYGNEVSFTTKMGWKIVKAGHIYSMGIKNDGTLWGWGNNETGQLGDGTSISKNIPVQIGSDNNWADVIPGGRNTTGDGYWTMGLKTDGSLWGWGKNNSGQLGDGTNVDRFTPVRIGNENWKQISAGDRATNGIKMDGTLWSWGNIWNPNTNSYSWNTKNPLQLTGLVNCKQVVCGYDNAMIVKNDGTLWAYGNNSSDILGLGGSTNLTVPLQQIGTSTNWSKIIALGFATKSDGTAWGWGNGNNGQFGNGTNSNYNSPTQISTNLGSNSLEITRGAFMTYNIKQDGTLWGTGSGILGDGTVYGNSRFVFTQVGTLNNWTKVAKLNSDITFAVQNNGSLWVCGGDNNYGQLGIGDNNSSTQKLSFTLVD